jgi:hypothetical protein
MSVQPLRAELALRVLNLPERVHQLNLGAKPLTEHPIQVENLGGTPGQHDLLDLIVARCGVEELEGFLQLGRKVLAHAVQHAENGLGRVIPELLARLDGLGLLARQVELALDGLGVPVPAEDDVAPEDRC